MAANETERWKVRVGAEETDALFEPADTAPARGVLVLGHGAGGSMEYRNLAREAATFRGVGLGVARFNFLYRAAGRKYPDKMPLLMECYRAVVESVVGAGLQTGPTTSGRIEGKAGGSKDPSLRPRLFLGGHSMGGRVSTMLAAEGYACDGLILLAYPLHAPGKFDVLRAEHLARITAPVLCFNGTRDDFARRDLMDAVVAKLPGAWTQHWIEHADHSFAVRKKDGRCPADVDAEIREAALPWLDHHAK